MRQTLLYLFFFCFLTSCETTKKYVHYQETKNQLTSYRFSSILIIGTGTSGTNLFLENLSDELNRNLKEKNIQTVYFHLGNTDAEARKSFDEIKSKGRYHAVLYFAQVDETHNPIVLKERSGDVSTPGGTVHYSTDRVVRFRQKFLVKYFDFVDLSQPLIEADLAISIDFLNPKDYSQLTQQILASLKLK